MRVTNAIQRKTYKRGSVSMHYELRLFSKSEKYPSGYCFQVAHYSNAVLALEQFGKSVELAEGSHKSLADAKMPAKAHEILASYIQLVRRHDAATYLDQVATWEYQQ